jgi:hypothetical protein
MAIIAVWLAALAPTISRVDAWRFPELGAWCEPVDAHHHGDEGARGHDDAGAACGYCTLFTHSPGLAGAFHAAGVPHLSLASLTPAAPDREFSPRAVFHTHPRGPPVAAHA